VVVIWNKIRKRIKPEFDLEVVLYETPQFVLIRGE
jgi:6-pyruvoyltetrahydropterin/6-carboxytetrahydropterin synthase